MLVFQTQLTPNQDKCLGYWRQASGVGHYTVLVCVDLMYWSHWFGVEMWFSEH